VASLSNRPDGSRVIQFTHPDGSRKTIRLGKVARKPAETVKRMVEALLAALKMGVSPPEDVSSWVAQLLPWMRDKLVAVGLVAASTESTKETESDNFKTWCEEYLAKRVDLKDRTTYLLGQVIKSLVAEFGPDAKLKDITKGHAEEWRLSLIAKGLGDNTIRRRCGRAKQFFAAAIRKRLITENPFDGFKTNVRPDKSKFFFVSREMSDKIMENCGAIQNKLVFGLARWGGLRTPSETLALRWEHVDWENECIKILSPKTERHEGHESRLIPMFPELRPLLEDARELAADGEEHVVTICRGDGKHFRTIVQQAIRKSGFEPWPKLFQNLRSTRETELVETFPVHVATAWIGNSAPVAKESYFQVTPEHFARALQKALRPSDATTRHENRNAQNDAKKSA